MAVERMRLLSVVGKEENINSFIMQYLLKSGMQPENAVKVFEKGWNLSYFTYDNTVRELQKECQELEKQLDMRKEKRNKIISVEIEKLRELEEIKTEISDIKSNYNSLIQQMEEQETKKNEMEAQIQILTWLKDLDIELQELYELRYMRFRYGRVSKENYAKILEELHDINAFVIEVGQEQDYVWILYFTTSNYSKKADSFFNIAKFERIWIPKEIMGKPQQALKNAESTKLEAEETRKELERKLEIARITNLKRLSVIKQELELYSQINVVKRYMAHDKKGNFYVVGWLPLSNLEKMIPQLEMEQEIDYVVKTNDEVASTPPTHLKNNRIVKPFETIVEMYGLPNYTEIDPTTFVALTTFLMFGFMFGDIGHGLVIFILGLILAIKKVALGPVFCYGGIASMIFGALYGSIFGKEDIIPQLLIRPMDNIQTMLIAGISIGVILIIIAMFLNVTNGIKNKDKAKIFLDSNGLAGIVFYITVLVSVVAFAVNANWQIPTGIAVALIGIPLILIFFKENISSFIEKKKDREKSSFIEKFFEMFEMLLSFASNTISFVRIAAFAINHVGLCMAVYILANMVSGSGELIVGIIGNIIVIALEGLIVAIQVLRLEYYELFSRFYSGDGRQYEPIKIKD